jgi:hypothetical protein
MNSSTQISRSTAATLTNHCSKVCGILDLPASVPRQWKVFISRRGQITHGGSHRPSGRVGSTWSYADGRVAIVDGDMFFVAP